ncbi:MAG: hypothetical protein U0271_28670 [Polyangiaceae bacterium]
MRAWLAFLLFALAGCAGAKDSKDREDPIDVAVSSVSAPGATSSSVSTSLVHPDWREVPRATTGPTDIPIGDREFSLLAFEFDAVPVAAWRYDACVKERACQPRQVPQPFKDPDTAPAVGMEWQDADQFCKTHGMSVQSAPQDIAIREAGYSALGQSRYPELRVDADRVVVAGFRCTRVLD